MVDNELPLTESPVTLVISGAPIELCDQLDSTDFCYPGSARAGPLSRPRQAARRLQRTRTIFAWSASVWPVRRAKYTPDATGRPDASSPSQDAVPRLPSSSASAIATGAGAGSRPN